MPDDVMDALEDRVYGCDICQDVCPWNRGVEKRRADVSPADDARPAVSLVDWLTRDGDALIEELDRLYVPRNDAALAPPERARRARQRRDATPTQRARGGARGRSRPGARRRGGQSGRGDRGARGMSDVDPAERLRILAHELRSPVAALSALVEAAPPVTEPARATPPRRARVAAGRDIERLLTDPELLSLRRGPVDVAALAVGPRRPRRRRARVGEAIVDGDPTRLRQVLANLVANGLRHGTRVEIEVGESDGDGRRRRLRRRPGRLARPRPVRPGRERVRVDRLRALARPRHRRGARGSLDYVPDGAPGARFRLALPSAAAGR